MEGVDKPETSRKKKERGLRPEVQSDDEGCFRATVAGTIDARRQPSGRR